MPRPVKHVNVYQSPAAVKAGKNQTWYFNLVSANGKSPDGPSKPFANRPNARRAAGRLYPDVKAAGEIRTVAHKDRNS
jgi:hypothetical protein